MVGEFRSQAKIKSTQSNGEIYSKSNELWNSIHEASSSQADSRVEILFVSNAWWVESETIQTL